MKKKASIILTIILLLTLLIAVVPANAQLGDSDVSSFTVQNISGSSAQVQVKFIAEDGTVYTPAQLDAGGTFTNPFSLDAGQSKQVYVPNIPSDQLPTGRYALVITSSAQIVAQAGVAGTGTLRFGGSYSGFFSGDTTTYLASAAYNYYGWFSMISVQNLGTDPADVLVTINCANGAVGTLTQNDIPTNASYTWALKDVVPTGFTTETVCDGSAIITSDQPIAAVNNQNLPATGATNTFESVAQGSPILYVTSLSNAYYGWNSALTIRKLDAGDTTVTIDYGGSWTNDTCDLTDAVPSCKLYIPNFVESSGRYGAKITNSAGLDLLAIVGTTNGALSGAVSGISAGSDTVAIPNVTKNYYGWVTAITCQNVSTTPTTIHVEYAGYSADAYDVATSLSEGDSVQVYVPNEAFLPDGFQGGATVTANAAGAGIACIVGNTNTEGDTDGDWTVSYNAYNVVAP